MKKLVLSIVLLGIALPFAGMSVGMEKVKGEESSSVSSINISKHLTSIRGHRSNIWEIKSENLNKSINEKRQGLKISLEALKAAFVESGLTGNPIQAGDKLKLDFEFWRKNELSHEIIQLGITVDEDLFDTPSMLDVQSEDDSAYEKIGIFGNDVSWILPENLDKSIIDALRSVASDDGHYLRSVRVEDLRQINAGLFSDIAKGDLLCSCLLREENKVGWLRVSGIETEDFHGFGHHFYIVGDRDLSQRLKDESHDGLINLGKAQELTKESISEGFILLESGEIIRAKRGA